MEKSKVFVGPIGSGKTRRALEIFRELNAEEVNKCVFLEGRDGNLFGNPFLFSCCSRNTTTIIIDDTPINFDWEYLLRSISEGVVVHKRGEPPIVIFPKFIVTTLHMPSWVAAASYTRRCSIQSFN